MAPISVRNINPEAVAKSGSVGNAFPVHTRLIEIAPIVAVTIFSEA